MSEQICIALKRAEQVAKERGLLPESRKNKLNCEYAAVCHGICLLVEQAKQAQQKNPYVPPVRIQIEQGKTDQLQTRSERFYSRLKKHQEMVNGTGK